MPLISRRQFCFLGATAGIALTGCASCRIIEEESVTDPSGQWCAVAYTYDCNATKWWINCVSLFRKGETVRGRGTLLELSELNENGDIIYGLTKPSRLGRGSIAIRLKWLAARVLKVSYPREARVLRRERCSRGIEVQFEPLPANVLTKELDYRQH